MGWKQRAWYLDPEVGAAVFDRNGNGGPTVWVDGRIVGGWVQRRDGTIAVRLLTDVGAEQRARDRREAAAASRNCSATSGSPSASRHPCRPRCCR